MSTKKKIMWMLVGATIASPFAVVLYFAVWVTLGFTFIG